MNLAFQEPDIDPGLCIMPPVVLFKPYIVIEFQHFLNRGLNEYWHLVFF